jgi:hypothetical protein
VAEEDKVSLTRRRAELVESLAGPLPALERVRIQGELSVVNAKIKALNTTEAAQLKATADHRRVTGLVEAQANAARARARLDRQLNGDDTDDAADADDDPAQTATINNWIVAVLQRGGAKVRRARDGSFNLIDAPAKWVVIAEALSAGIHAAARGEKLPEIAVAELKARKRL